MLRIRYLDTSMKVRPEDHLFTTMLTKYFDRNVQISRNINEMVDVEFVSDAIRYSDFQKLMLRSKAKFNLETMNSYHKITRLGYRDQYKTKANKRIWFTGENLRAPFDCFDATFSFDQTDSNLNNTFFPYWFYRCDWFGRNRNHEIEEKIEILMQPRKPIQREKNVLTFSSQYEVSRARLVQSVRLVLPVDGYGKQYGKYVSSKAQISENYGLQICNENDLFPNYVTEKLQEAWISRNVPIWAGLDEMGYFNKEAFIDVTRLSSEEVSERILDLTMDEIMYRQGQPLLVRQPSLDEAINLFSKLFSVMEI
jgi:Glycosyltransferase family 10 (fucosyltransferase) C-term/Alpha-(1,3)-fucosyltransferase FucT N-terminal domain